MKARRRSNKSQTEVKRQNDKTIRQQSNKSQTKTRWKSDEHRTKAKQKFDEHRTKVYGWTLNATVRHTTDDGATACDCMLMSSATMANVTLQRIKEFFLLFYFTLHLAPSVFKAEATMQERKNVFLHKKKNVYARKREKVRKRKKPL